MRESIAVCQSLPGPLAIQVGILIAYLRGGFWGAWAGGWAFILPNFIIVAALGSGGATAARLLADQVPSRMLAAGELIALQLTFLSSFRAALLTCAAFAAIGIGTALVRGHERSPAARITHEHAS
jgi:chromate transport protein ChrA